MNFEDICLLVLVLQGFLICWFEYRVYFLHNERFKERAAWRKSKQKSTLRKSGQEINTISETLESPLKTTIVDSPNKITDADVVGSVR